MQNDERTGRSPRLQADEIVEDALEAMVAIDEGKVEAPRMQRTLRRGGLQEGSARHHMQFGGRTAARQRVAQR